MVDLVGGIIVLIIVIVVFFVAGNQLLAFVTDSSDIISQQLRDSDVQIPVPKTGSTVCDLFLTASWREKSSNEVFEVSNVLFTNTDGKTVSKEVSNCHVKTATSFSLLSMMDFFGSSSASVKPLDVIIPQQSAFAQTYKMSFVLIDENLLEKKIPHLQNIPYDVPAFTFEYDYEQKMVFREIVVGNYVLEMRPTDARWFDHGESQAYRQNITVP